MTDWLDQEADASLATVHDRIEQRVQLGSGSRHRIFFQRLDAEYRRIFRLAHALYGWRWDFAWHLEDLIASAAQAAADRPKWLRKRDAGGHPWLFDGRSIWAMAYVDRLVGDVASLSKADAHLDSLGVTHLHLMPPYRVPDGPDDGGYAVSSYRHLRKGLGSMDELRSAIRDQHRSGRGVVLDVVANHTADDHRWAEAAKRGEEPYASFYLLFDRREEVDEWVGSLRMIFPNAGEPFVWRPDVEGVYGGRWVWSTFFDFQWDLDYRNPRVLVAMMEEILFLANLGVAGLRMDATPFLWKMKGTSCENLPEAHLLLQLMAAIIDVVAPSVVFLSEAIVHPSEVSRFVRPDECPLGYNPLVMALIWEAQATGRVELLADAMDRRMVLPDGSQWLTYVRSHDDIGWGFADEDAQRLGIDPDDHRRFLSSFYAGDLEGSWSAGARFQENPFTGDVRISGATASLAGLERAVESGDEEEIDRAVARILAAQTIAFTSVGIPMLFLGDEIGTTNDHRYRDDPTHRDDNRWLHRPRYDWQRLAEADADPTTPQGRVLAGVRRLVGLRADWPQLFSSTACEVVDVGHPAVLGYRRSGPGGVEAVVMVSFAAVPVEVDNPVEGHRWVDGFDKAHPWPAGTVALAPYQARIAVRPAG